MAGPDILDGGPAPPRGRRPRWQLLAGTLALAGVAALLAARSDPDPAAAPTPVPTVTALPGPPLPAMVASAGTGVRSAYALITRCNSAAVRACELRLFHRDVAAGAAWTPRPLRFEVRSTTRGIPFLLVGADDRPVVVDLTQQWAYASVAGSFTRRRLALGPVVDRVPAGGVLIEGQCAGCEGRLVVLDAPAGLLRPLRTQPPVGAGGLRSHDRRGDRIWVVSGGDPAVGAASADGGRSWRRFPVPRTAADELEVLAAPDGGAYLVGTRLDELSDSRPAGIWRARAPGAAWQQLRAAPMPASVQAVLAGERGLLVVDARGTSWRLGPDGAFERLPAPGPARPGFLLSDGSALLVATPRDPPDGPATVVTSADEGESWQLERLAG